MRSLPLATVLFVGLGDIAFMAELLPCPSLPPVSSSLIARELESK